MKTKILTGVSESDLDQKQWEWQTTANPPVRIIKHWPDELLPLTMRTPIPGTHLPPAKDSWQRQIDYEEV
jgi:hypothetical protein